MKFKNYLNALLMVGAFTFGTHQAFAQYVVKDTYLEATGVSNDGKVAGYEAWAGPYYIWDADAQTNEEIGGAAPGNGVGGKAHFSDDGNFLSGSSYIEIPIDTNWQRNTNSQYPYIYNSIEFPDNQANIGYASGQSLTYNGNGIILKTVNGGDSWQAIWTDTNNLGLETMSFPTLYTGYVGGWNDYFAKTNDGGSTWSALTPAGTNDVFYYTATEFKDYDNGVVTAHLMGGSPAVYITADGGSTWTTGSGLAGFPTKIKYVGGDTYFLTDEGGHIQKSTDNGLTWTTVFTAPGGGFLTGLNFYDSMTGYALGEDDMFPGVYKTTDGGTTWSPVNVFGAGGGYAIWRDIAWVDQNHLFITGTPDTIYESTDGGTTWSWSNQTLFDGVPALYQIAVTNNAVHISGSQGTFYKKSTISSKTAAEMSRYDVVAEEWVALGNLGFQVDISTSSGYNISADGTTVVGLSYADPANGNGTTSYAHAVAWTQADGIIDLGSLHSGINRSTRADAVSGDGSVIAGWQDFNGPWKAARWKKTGPATYSQEYLLINPNGDPTDEFNQLGQAGAVSADGIWVGGQGDYAFLNPWIWSETTGLVDLGDMNLDPGTRGRVSGINHDGSIVVGWYQSGGGPWDPPVYTPFIWTPTDGTQDLNDFITNTLLFDMDGDQVFTPNSISTNGKYITGLAFNENPAPWGEYKTFRLDLSDWLLSTNDAVKTSYVLYPNPVENILIVESLDTIDTIEIYNLLGQAVINEKVNQLRKEIDMSLLNNGMYLVKVIANGKSTTSIIIKK
jgi:photosystem II stability/assembly factor-like uncharacterized protein